jgi:hypothetical protein
VNGITASPYTFKVSPTTNSTYTVTALSDASCAAGASQISGAAAVTVNPTPGAVISGGGSICTGSTATVSVALTGTPPWNLTYSDGTTGTTVNGITTSPYTFTVSPTVSSTYTLTTLSDASCTAAPSDLSGTASIIVTSLPVAPVFNISTAVVQAGTTVAFSVNADPGILSYQWSFTGTGGTVLGNTDAVQVNFDATATNGNLQVNGVNSCGSGPATILPITVDHDITQFSGFTAVRAGSTALLKWTTQYEFQVDHYEIEYSVDSVNYNLIATVPAVGNSLVPQSYAYVQKHPIAGWNEYQTKAVGKNGTTVSSTVQAVYFDPNNFWVLTLYPNPTNATLHISFQGRPQFDDPVTGIDIYDLSGRMVKSVAVSGYANDIAVDVSNLPQGEYIVSIRYKNGNPDSGKFLKE